MQKPPPWMFYRVLNLLLEGHPNVSSIFKLFWISKVIDYLLLGKSKKKQTNKLENSWTKTLQNITNSYNFQSCVIQPNIGYYRWNILKHISYRFALNFTQRRWELFFHTLHMLCFIIATWYCANSWHIFDRTFWIAIWFENNLPSFEYFRKVAMTRFLWKARRDGYYLPSSLLIRYNTHAFWRTTSSIQANGDHFHFFHLDTNPVLCNVLVQSFDKTLVVTVEFFYLEYFFRSFVVVVIFVVDVFLEYSFFQFCSSSEQIS